MNVIFSKTKPRYPRAQSVAKALAPLALSLSVAGNEGAAMAATPSLFSSVLPSSRSVETGTQATFFATVVNGGDSDANACTIAPRTSVPASFFFQETDPATNALVGIRDASVNIAAGEVQTFLFAFAPSSVLAPIDVELVFDCENSEPAPTLSGLNTVLLGASSVPTPDVIALAATPDRNGIVTASPAGVFSIASVNVGASGNVTVSADTGTASLPIGISLCQTDATSGACINPTTPDAGPVTASINAGDTPTFSIFINTSGNIAFDPAQHRVFVRFKDSTGATRGATSVAVRTQQTNDDGAGGGEVVVGPTGNINTPQGGTIGSVTTPLSAERFANQFSAPVGRPVAASNTIAYVRSTSSGPNVRTIRGDGSNDRSVTTIPNASAFAGDLSWRADGTEIAFVSNFELSVWSSDVYAVTVDGSNLRRLTSVPRPIAYPNYPQGKATLTILHPETTGGVTIGYIEGSQQAFGWLGSSVETRVVEYPLADFGDGLVQESVVFDHGLCFFDAASNVDVVAGTTIAIPQRLPPSSLTSDFACAQHLSPQWSTNDEIFYMKRRASQAETLFNLSFTLTRGPVEALGPTTDGETVTDYQEDFELVEGNREEALSMRINPVLSTNEFLLVSQVDSPANLTQEDKIYVGSLTAPSQSQLRRLAICPDQVGCDLGDAQFIPNESRFVYSTKVTPLALETLKSRLRLYTNNDGVVTDETLIEIQSGNLGKVAVSPDRRRILVERTGVEAGAKTELWMYERDTGESRQFLADGSNPAWR